MNVIVYTLGLTISTIYVSKIKQSIDSASLYLWGTGQHPASRRQNVISKKPLFLFLFFYLAAAGSYQIVHFATFYLGVGISPGVSLEPK